MKKFAFLVLLMCFIVISCNKTEYQEKQIQKDLLIEQVSKIVNLRIIPGDPDDFLVTNCNNPYDVAGIITSKITYDILTQVRDKKSNASLLKNEFIEKVSRDLLALNLHPDTLDYNNVEFIIEDFFLDIYVREGFEIFIVKSKEIENIVNTSIFFNENQKRRVLIFSSSLRHTINMINEFMLECEMSKSGPWEDCFVDKLRELEDCTNCWTERIFCIFSWPTCLGLKALDCGIAAIK